MIIKKIVKVISIVFITLAIVFLVSGIINTILLKIEHKKIVPNGSLVEINGHRLHIYSEGDANNRPILVFMAGAGTAAPVYDFKILYSLFKDEYCIAVVEKLGYGYADIVNTDRDIDTILDETRKALQSAVGNGPFVLFPHSMSGLEALYWLAKHPKEITAIIGLDMAFPDFYNLIKNMQNASKIQAGIMNIAAKIGLTRIPFFSKLIVDYKGLTIDEYKQAEYLAYRNFVNIVIKNETKSVFANAEKVANVNYSNINGNILLFSSNGKEIGDFWISSQNEFAEKMNAELILLDCGHYIHQFEPLLIAEKSKKFLNDLLR
jgi:pimeloyl-ACP methyl ester carboxylesterase